MVKVDDGKHSLCTEAYKSIQLTVALYFEVLLLRNLTLEDHVMADFSFLELRVAAFFDKG